MSVSENLNPLHLVYTAWHSTLNGGVYFWLYALKFLEFIVKVRSLFLLASISFRFTTFDNNTDPNLPHRRTGTRYKSSGSCTGNKIYDCVEINSSPFDALIIMSLTSCV